MYWYLLLNSLRVCVYLTFSIWLRTQVSQPNPELVTLQAEFWALANRLTKTVKTCNWKIVDIKQTKNVLWHCTICSLKTPLKKITRASWKTLFSIDLRFRAKQTFSRIHYELCQFYQTNPLWPKSSVNKEDFDSNLI